MDGFVFNWQKEQKNSLLKWLLVTVLDTDQIEEASDRTDKFTRVELKLTLNGMELDSHRFIGGLERILDAEVEAEVERYVREKLPRLNELRERLDLVEKAMGQSLLQEARNAGLEIDESELDRDCW